MSYGSYEEYARSHFQVVGQSGSELDAICPWHSDNSPSLRINIDKGVYYCLAADTEVITWEGVRQIKELAGSSHTLLTSQGWVEAPISSFGMQPLMAVNLSRNGVCKTIYATPEHRWFIGAGGNKREVTTVGLNRRHYLESAPLPAASGTRKPSRWGVAHGLVFGDGTITKRGEGRIALYGEKNMALAEYFSGDHQYKYATKDGLPYILVTGLPNHFKMLPPRTESPSYLYGWLAGYFAADGHVDKDGSAILSSARRDHLEAAQLLAMQLGIKSGTIRQYERVGLGSTESCMYQMHLYSSGLNEEFFLVEEHRCRWKSAAHSYDRVRWHVESVEQTDRVEEVFCATVSGIGDFALADFILTGNCHGCHKKGSLGRMAKEGGERFNLGEVNLHDYILNAVATPEKHERVMSEAFLTPLMMTTDYWRLRGLSPKVIKRFQLGQDLTNNTATIPVRNEGRQLLGVIERQLGGKGSKYKNPPGFKKTHHLFGAWELDSTHDSVCIVEGPVDALAMWDVGIPAVSLYGSKVSTRQVELLKRLNIHHVVLFTDHDEAGTIAMEDVIGALPGSGILWSMARYGSKWGKDPAALKPAQRKMAYRHALSQLKVMMDDDDD